MAFSATEAAFEGFKITRGRPVAALAWAAVQLVFVVLQRVALIWLLGPQIQALTPVHLFSQIPSDDLTRLTGLTFEFLLVDLVLFVLFYGVLFAAVERAVLRHGEGGPGWLRLGGDELRQIAVLFCFSLVLLAIYLAVGTLGSVIGAVLFSGLGAAGAFLGLSLGLVVAVVVVVWVGVRLSMALPATFDRRRFVLFDTWTLTRGRFWPLLGAYIVAWLMSLLVTVLVVFIGYAIADLLPGAAGGNATTFGALLTPGGIIEILFTALAGGLTTPILLAPAVYAYRELAGAGDAAKAF
jgi:hypothetical protein